MKKAMTLSMALMMSATLAAPVLASPKVNVNFDGAPMSFDVEPFIEEDRTLVPMRAIFEAAGASVTWDDETKTVVAAYTAEEESKIIVLQIGNTTAFAGNETVTLDVPAKIVEDRTFVPLRFVMETLGKEVTWNSETYTVDIK